MSKSSLPTIIIIVGITGDLSKRYLLPAIEELAEANELPDKFKIIGVTRQQFKTNDFLKSLKHDTRHLSKHLEMCVGVNLARREDYGIIRRHIASVEAKFGTSAQRLFYLSIPPQVSKEVVELLGASGLGKVVNTKLLLEKPFGTNLETAKELIAHTRRYFHEEQVYRIDHYLAKEMTQNMVVFREANPLFKRTWNRDYIDSIEVVATEAIDIEGRVNFYQQTGALRDVMQSHILQLAALTLMNEASKPSQSIPSRRLEALQLMHIPTSDQIRKFVKRGQYKGYRQEVGSHKSTIETFVSMLVVSSNPRWQDVTIKLTTGKALSRKLTQVRIKYKCDKNSQPNELVLHIQPDEGTELRLWSKAPGYESKIEQQPLKFLYKDHFSKLPNAYEQVILDAINSDHRLFASSQEILESWRIVEPVLDAWSQNSEDLIFYRKGSKLSEILDA